jgi:hypothetical protein
MILEFACLADEATAAEDKLYIHGAGLRRIQVPQVPWVIHLAVAARFNAAVSQLGETHHLHVRLTTPNDQILFPLPETQIVLGTQNIIQDADQLGVAIVFRIGAIAVRETGWHLFSLLIDQAEEPIVKLPLRIAVPGTLTAIPGPA